MKTFYLKSILIFILILAFLNTKAQRVSAIMSGVTVDSILKVKPNASKIAMDPVSKNLFYTTVGGDIYEVLMSGSSSAKDTLRYSSSDHGITFLQGLCFRDSVMFVCGNIWSSITGTGKIVKGTLQANGSRIWTDVVTTVPYPSSSSNGDHGFSGVSVDPSGHFIFVSSGARTHLGEIRTNGGAWPGKREVPLTCRLFRFPIHASGILLQNDSTLLDNSGYVYAWGIRNAYDMAWDGNDTLFAIDNSGERDDPEELNWLRKGKHYGYPWRMGGNDNPLQYSPYNVNADPLVNHQSGGYQSGWFADNPGFPATPAGITFSEPIRNYGSVADNFRDAVTGEVKDASDEETYISSFTSHRSPLGLVFDKDSILAAPYRGKGFVLSFMPGGDSTGYTPLSPWGSPCPFVDTSRELVMMNLSYDSGIDNYTMTTSNVVKGFYLPVDAEFIKHSLYVIENGGNIWKITFPLHLGIDDLGRKDEIRIYPNPFNKFTTIKFKNPNKEKLTLNVYSIYGHIVKSIENITTDEIIFDRMDLSGGIYFAELRTAKQVLSIHKICLE